MEVRSGLVSERFSELYRREYPLVYRFVLRRTDAASAEDITNEAFAIAWQKFSDIPSQPDQARAWLYAVARNHILRHWRSDSRNAALQVRVAEDTQLFLISPDIQVNASLDLRKAWRQLSVTDQEILALLGWEELSLAAAAKTVGISVPTARLRLKRARAALRRALDATEPTNSGPPIPSPARSPRGAVGQQTPRRPNPINNAKTLELINA
jgi:RNA polymerase sigma-70 factor, ECF subfamily